MGTWGQELGDKRNIFWFTYFQNIFLYDSKTLIFSYLHGSVGQGNYYLFFSLSFFGQHNLNWKGAWEWEHGGRSVVMGAIFF